MMIGMSYVSKRTMEKQTRTIEMQRKLTSLLFSYVNNRVEHC